MPQLDYLYLYDDPDAQGLNTDYLGHWIASVFPDAAVAVRSDFLTFHLSRFDRVERDELTEVLVAQLERAQVDNLVRPADRDRLPALPPEERELDVVYEAESLQKVLRLLIPEEETVLDRVHIMFTTNYLGHWRADETYLRLQPSLPGLGLSAGLRAGGQPAP